MSTNTFYTRLGISPYYVPTSAEQPVSLPVPNPLLYVVPSQSRHIPQVLAKFLRLRGIEPRHPRSIHILASLPGLQNLTDVSNAIKRALNLGTWKPFVSISLGPLERRSCTPD